MIPVVVVWIGGSTSIGTAPPLTGNALPASARDYQQGIQKTTLNAINSGAQDGFLDCMDAQGFAVTLVERGQQGITVNYLQTVHLPNAITDVASLGLTPDVLVVIAGSNDATSLTNATLYRERVFGPWFSLGPGSLDTSLVAQARAAWGDHLPLVLPTVTNHNGEDLLAGLPENGDHHWQRRVRAEQLAGCDDDPWCHPVESGILEVPMATDDHPTSQGYYNLGWMICQRTVLDVL